MEKNEAPGFFSQAKTKTALGRNSESLSNVSCGPRKNHRRDFVLSSPSRIKTDGKNSGHGNSNLITCISVAVNTHALIAKGHYSGHSRLRIGAVKNRWPHPSENNKNQKN